MPDPTRVVVVWLTPGQAPPGQTAPGAPPCPAPEPGARELPPDTP